MILTREWLAEWLDLKWVTTPDLCKTLNEIGLEVERVEQVRMPVQIVVGEIKDCQKHPDAQKLSICQVDTGYGMRQIVCGAPNVAKGQLVPVALPGAYLPNGVLINPTKLRGVSSEGMICSSEEIGLPKTNDGIMIFDSSIGKIRVGLPIEKIASLNDDIIEIGLTPNRGDCLSIYGLARDIGAALDLKVKDFEKYTEGDNQTGIGKLINVQVNDKTDSSFVYRAIEQKKITTPLLMNIRLGWMNEKRDSSLENFNNYITHSVGVLFRLYPYRIFSSFFDELPKITIKKDASGGDGIFSNDVQISKLGCTQDKAFQASDKDEIIILEGSYTHPDIVTALVSRADSKNDKLLYRALRGSEPDIKFGISYYISMLKKYCDVNFYSGKQQVLVDTHEKKISINIKNISSMIGQEINKTDAVNILKKLGFELSFRQEESDDFNIKIPKFRHDIQREQDVCEEILRIIGIDNIKPKPLAISESSKENKCYEVYLRKLGYRYKAAGTGFFETVNYVFDNPDRVKKYGLDMVEKELDVRNPINNELSTLRTSLLPNLIESVERNTKRGMRRIALFEIGVVYNKKREENRHFGAIWSGELERPSIINNGKPNYISFFTFTRHINNIIGNFELKQANPTNNMFNPYEYVVILQDGNEIGVVGRVHLKIERELGLAPTYMCEIVPSKVNFVKKKAHPYSSFPSIERDLSLLVSKKIKFEQVYKIISKDKSELLTYVFPIDVYRSDSLGDNTSLTIRLVFRSNEKTLEDSDVNSIIQDILDKLNKELGIKIR